LYTSVDYTTL